MRQIAAGVVKDAGSNTRLGAKPGTGSLGKSASTDEVCLEMCRVFNELEPQFRDFGFSFFCLARRTKTFIFFFWGTLAAATLMNM